MPKDSLGRWHVRPRPGPWRPQRPSQWLSSRECFLVYRLGVRCVYTRWLPYKGLLAYGSSAAGSPALDRIYCDHREVMMALKRREVGTGAGYVVPALSADSKLLGKLPALMEFLTATAYEDGSPRVPGYLWISNRIAAFEVTVFDPDGCAKLPCLGKTLDDALGLAETHLRADTAPWQVDGFLVKRAAEKKKK
jgi:hypothetical protein